MSKSQPKPALTVPTAVSSASSGFNASAFGPLAGIAQAAFDAALDTMSLRINTGHLVLAVLSRSDDAAVKLLYDWGVEQPLLATQIQNLGRMDEGTADGHGGKLSAKALAALTGANAADDAIRLATLLTLIVRDEASVGTHALTKLKVNVPDLRHRLERMGGAANAAPTMASVFGPPATSLPSSSVSTPAASISPAPVPVQYRLTSEQYAALAIDGEYQTSAQKHPFRLIVRFGDIHIYSGWRYKKKAFDGDGNAVFWDKEKVLRESIDFVRRMGEVELGSCADNKVPGPNTFEAFLRQFSIEGNLASYLPAVLETLGAIRIEKRAGGVHWAIPANELPPTKT